MNKVFISYSHKDKKWLERLQVHLAPLIRNGTIDCWDDTHINPGAKWLDEIEEALAAATVAILFVSADYLASEFIVKNELPPLLAAARAVILPVIVGRCRFKETPSLAQFQAVNDPSKPLSAMTEDEQNQVLYEVTKAVERSIANIRVTPKPATLPEGNPLFTGREDILAQIEKALKSQGRAALSGMGGAGKTQTAIEYAHRHADEYSEIFLDQRRNAGDVDLRLRFYCRKRSPGSDEGRRSRQDEAREK